MKKKRLKKLITWVVLICVLAGGGGAGYWYFTKDDTVAAAMTFQQSRVAKGTITQGVSGSGSVAVSESEDAIVSEAATVSEVMVAEGDVVKKGDVLATFEGEDVSLSLNKAKLSLEQQQMSLEQAQDKWKNLQVSGGSEDEIASAAMSIKSAQLNIDQTKLEIEDYEEKAKAPDPIVAPIDGTVTTVNVKTGDQVSARLSAFSLVNYNKLEVSISADELDITKIKVGQKADISIEALSGQKITGTVTEISKDGSSSNGVATFPVIISLDNIENVLPGMSADVQIIIEQKTDALIVPVDAVETVAGRYFVRVPNDGTSSSASAGGTTASSGQGGQRGGAQDGAAPSGAPNGTANGSANGSTNGAANGGNGSDSGKGTAEGAKGSGGSGWSGRGGSSNAGAAGGAGSTTGTNSTSANGANTDRASQRIAAMMNQGNGEFKMQEITVGITTDSQVEVVSGLNQGDTVLIPVVVNSTSSTTQIRSFGNGLGGGFGGGGFGGGNFGGGNFGGNRTTTRSSSGGGGRG